MFVFASSGDVGALELQAVATKQELPFKELVVVVGRTQEAPSRQVTCVSGRVKPLGQRLLLVLPVPVTADESTGAAVQILDAGEVAAEFAHDVRSCFPTLVRRSPLAADSDDESGDDDSDSDTSRNDTRAAEVERKRLALESAEQQHTEAKRAASEFMAHTRVTLLRSLEELPLAFELHDHVNVCAALQQEEVLQCDELGGAPVQCQWLCVALPALSPSSSDSTTSRNGPAAPHNFALLFSYATTCVQKETETPFLSIPLPRTPRTYFESPAVDSDSAAADVFTDATVLSFGAKREATVHGGGKTPAETVHNIRLRHASGTFCTLVLPATTWDAIAGKYAAVVPPIYGELRLRRVLGPAANERLTLHLV